MPCNVSLPATVEFVPLSVMLTVSNVEVGNCATSKKSFVFRWPVRRSVSVQIELVSISTLFPVFASLLPLDFNSPENFLNPPSCERVTLDPTNEMVELSGPNTYDRASPVGAGAPADVPVPPPLLLSAPLTVAFATLSAGLPHPVNIAVAAAAITVNINITPYRFPNLAF